MAKTVPSSKFTEWKGLDRIQAIVHEMNCIWRELSKDDFGIDGEIEVVSPKPDGNGYQTTGGIIKVQAKSGAAYVKKDDGSSFATPVRKEDLDYWNACTFPVLLIVYHPDDDALYFKEVKSYIHMTPEIFRPPLELVFNKSADLFSASAKNTVGHHATVSPTRLSFENKERLFSNLLRITRLPSTLTRAQTRLTSYECIRKDIKGYKAPFCIHERCLYTLSDLRDERNVLRSCCDVASIAEVPVSSWVSDDALRSNLVFLLNQLFRSHCYRRGLRYNPHFRRTYFPRDNQTDKEFVRPWTSPRSGYSDQRTVAKYYEYGTFTFWRHLAAEFSFIRCGTTWYLQVLPKYLFTDDGEAPSDPELVGPYTTSQKAHEHNIQVLNHVLFWAHTLADGKPKIVLTLFDTPMIIIETEPATCIADFALPLDPATYEEKPPSAQMLLFGLDEIEDDANEY